MTVDKRADTDHLQETGSRVLTMKFEKPVVDPQYGCQGRAGRSGIEGSVLGIAQELDVQDIQAAVTLGECVETVDTVDSDEVVEGRIKTVTGIVAVHHSFVAGKRKLLEGIGVFQRRSNQGVDALHKLTAAP